MTRKTNNKTNGINEEINITSEEPAESKFLNAAVEHKGIDNKGK